MKLFKEIKELNENIESLDENEFHAAHNIDPAEAIATLKLLAPVLIIVLNFVMIFTGERADKKIAAVITYLNIISLIK